MSNEIIAKLKQKTASIARRKRSLLKKQSQDNDKDVIVIDDDVVPKILAKNKRSKLIKFKGATARWSNSLDHLTEDDYKKFCRLDNQLRLDFTRHSFKMIDWDLFTKEVFPKDSIFNTDPMGSEAFKRFWMAQKKRCEVILETVVAAGDKRSSVPLRFPHKVPSRTSFWFLCDQLLCLTISFLLFEDINDPLQSSAYTHLFELIQLHPDVEEVAGEDLEAVAKRRKAWRRILSEYNKPSTGRYTTLSLLYRRWGELKRMSSDAVLQYMRALDQLPPELQNAETPPDSIKQPHPLFASIVRRFPKILNEHFEKWVQGWWIDIAPYYYEEPKLDTGDIEVVESNAPVFEVSDSDREEGSDAEGKLCNGDAGSDDDDDDVPLATLADDEDSEDYEDDLIIIPDTVIKNDEMSQHAPSLIPPTTNQRVATVDDDFTLSDDEVLVLKKAIPATVPEVITVDDGFVSSDDEVLMPKEITLPKEVPVPEEIPVLEEVLPIPEDAPIQLPEEVPLEPTSTPDAVQPIEAPIEDDVAPEFGRSQIPDMRDCTVVLQRLDKEIDRILHQLWSYHTNYEDSSTHSDASIEDDAPSPAVEPVPEVQESTVALEYPPTAETAEEMHVADVGEIGEAEEDAEVDEWKVIQEFLPLSTTLRFKCFAEDKTKNPDFQTHLRSLSLDFLRKSNNKHKLRDCRKLTVDVVRDLNLERLVHYLKRNAMKFNRVALSYSQYRNSVLSVRLVKEVIRPPSPVQLEHPALQTDCRMFNVESENDEGDSLLTSTMDGLKMKVFRGAESSGLQSPAYEAPCGQIVQTHLDCKPRRGMSSVRGRGYSRTVYREPKRVHAPWIGGHQHNHTAINRTQVIKMLKGLQRPQPSDADSQYGQPAAQAHIPHSEYGHHNGLISSATDVQVPSTADAPDCDMSAVRFKIVNPGKSNRMLGPKSRRRQPSTDLEESPVKPKKRRKPRKKAPEPHNSESDMQYEFPAANGELNWEAYRQDHQYAAVKKYTSTKRSRREEDAVTLSCIPYDSTVYGETSLLTTAEYFKSAMFSSDSEMTY